MLTVVAFVCPLSSLKVMIDQSKVGCSDLLRQKNDLNEIANKFLHLKGLKFSPG